MDWLKIYFVISLILFTIYDSQATDQINTRNGSLNVKVRNSPLEELDDDYYFYDYDQNDPNDLNEDINFDENEHLDDYRKKWKLEDKEISKIPDGMFMRESKRFQAQCKRADPHLEDEMHYNCEIKKFNPFNSVPEDYFDIF